jgi:hypothetical protein
LAVRLPGLKGFAAPERLNGFPGALAGHGARILATALA